MMARLLLLIALFSASFVYGQTNKTLTINFTGYKGHKGNLYIAVYNSEESFLNNSRVTASKVIKAENKNTLVNFSVKENEYYAIAVFLDENENAKLDTNLFGIPQEFYGFSNNATGFMSSPGFKKAKLKMDTDKSITIQLH
jgi:uncharacterized protein (DUF2141 family)